MPIMTGKLSLHIAVSYILFLKNSGGDFKLRLIRSQYSFLLLVFINGTSEVIYLQITKTEPFFPKLLFFLCLN